MNSHFWSLPTMLVLLLGTAHAVCAQQFTITTSPNPPHANQPFQMSLTAPLRFDNGPEPAPTFVIDRGTVQIFLNRDCGFFECPGVPSVQTVTFTALGLPAGSYAVSIYQNGPPAVDVPVDGQLALTVTPDYTGHWWKSPAGSESGWGMSIDHQGDILFCVWFTYGADGNGEWLFMSDAEKAGDRTYSGAIYRATGPSFDSVPWSPSAVAITAVGQGTVTFSDADNGVFSYTVNGVTQSKEITRMVFWAPGS